MIEAGRYTARLVEAQIGIQEKDGKEYMLFTVETDTGDIVDHKGWLTERAAEYTIKTLRAFGWTGTDLASIQAGKDGLGSLLVTLQVEYEEYKGKSSIKTSIFAARNFTPAPQKTKLELGRRFLQLAKDAPKIEGPSVSEFKKRDKPANGAPPAAPRDAYDDVSDDQMPF